MDKTLIGAHVSYTKKDQLLQTIQDIISIKGNSGSIYITNSRGYARSEDINIDKSKLKEAQELANKNNIDIKNIIVHSPLVGNLANLDKESNTYKLTLDSYYNNLIIMNKLGLKYFNFHPGSAKNTNKGISQITKSINELHKKTKGNDTVILLETMMGKGNYIGKNFEQLNEIIKGVKDKSRIGVCMDTCHVWDAGYDIKNNLKQVLKDFNNKIGLDYLKAMHINDSKNKIGSAKDRHEKIGEGHIGLKALKKIVNHPKIKDLPKALETPYDSDNIKRWKNEIKLLLK